MTLRTIPGIRMIAVLQHIVDSTFLFKISGLAHPSNTPLLGTKPAIPPAQVKQKEADTMQASIPHARSRRAFPTAELQIRFSPSIRSIPVAAKRPSEPAPVRG